MKTLKSRAIVLFVILLSVTAICAALVFIPKAAKAQMICGARDDLAAAVAKQYNEHTVGIGTTPEGYAVEMFLADDGSYTFAIIQPGKKACVVVSGNDWQFIPEEKPSH